MVADLGRAACIEDALAGSDGVDKLSSGSYSALSDDDLFPGSTGVSVLLEADDDQGCGTLNVVAATPEVSAPPHACTKTQPDSLAHVSMQSGLVQMQLPERPALRTASPVTSDSMLSKQSELCGSAGSADDWTRSSDLASPPSDASLSAASSMVNISGMLAAGHHIDAGDSMATVADRLNNGLGSRCLFPCSHVHLGYPQDQIIDSASLPDACVGLAASVATMDATTARRVVVRPRRTTSLVPTQLACRGKKRGSASNHTCKVAPNPNGHACTSCGAQSTPVWRAGPFGPKTLCNACGVRYMKVAKKK